MPILVLDPGHGGSDSAGSSSPYGSRGASGLNEKDLNLELARRVASRMLGRALLTRSEDYNLSIRDRIGVAARVDADRFVSIHAGAAGRGAEVWVHERAGSASRALARRLASELGAAAVHEAELAVLSPEHHDRGRAACLVEIGGLSEQATVEWLTRGGGVDVLADQLYQALGEPTYGGLGAWLAKKLGQTWATVKRPFAPVESPSALMQKKAIQDHAGDVLAMLSHSGLDYRGQLGCIWAESGKAVALEAGFDFGKMICPGLRLAVSAEVGGTATRAGLMIAAIGPTALTSRAAGAPGSFHTTFPVLLALLQGARRGWSASLGASVGIEVPGLKELSAEVLSVGLSVDANARYEGERLLLRDPGPTFSQQQREHASVFAGMRLDAADSELHKAKPPLSRLCLLSAWGHKGGLELGVNAEATVKAPHLSVGVAAGAGVKGTLARTSYRLQLPAHGGADGTSGRLVTTLDAVIDYRQVALEAAAKAELVADWGPDSAKPPGVSAKKGYDVLNTMTYRAASLIWAHPEAPVPTLHAAPMGQWPGTGLCFGISLAPRRIRDLARHYKAAPGAPPVNASVIAAINAQLRTTEAELRDFFVGSWLDDPSSLPEAVLLEARWRAPVAGAGPALSWDAAQGCYEAADVLEHLEAAFKAGQSAWQLESIAARARIADEDQSEATFKLGVKLGQTKIGFSLSGIETVATHGVFDLYCHWYGELAAHPDPDPRARYALAVPPVALLHQ